MNKLVLVFPLLLALAGGYLVMIAIGADEAVELLPGHMVPKGLTGMIGAVVIFGAVAVAVETLKRGKKISSVHRDFSKS